MSRKHTLKCFTDRYIHIASGRCTADIRRDDRGFMVGDYIEYQEGAYHQGRFCLTGNTVLVEITYIDPWSLPTGFINLSIKKVKNG